MFFPICILVFEDEHELMIFIVRKRINQFEEHCSTWGSVSCSQLAPDLLWKWSAPSQCFIAHASFPAAP
jgi:hypothetical protein